jgi:uncharacterized glyoxalase superfamily protein PhnB
MAETPVNEKAAHGFNYTRPVLFVADVNRAIRFYVDVLGFWKKWHSGDGTGTVCQVNRGDTEVILCQDGSRTDKSRLFVELNAEEWAVLRREIAERSIPNQKTRWGYDCIQINDPDGNEWLFPYEDGGGA